MTIEILIMLTLLSSVTVIMATEWLPVDLTALLGLILLVVMGLVSPQQAFSGFSNDVIFVLASLFVLSSALAKSGITHLASQLILNIIKNKNFLASGLMTIVATLSAFFNNTNATAMLIPVTLQIARKAKVRASRLLMPLAFASILGGTCTLIGTSTNLASSGLLTRLNMRPWGLFEFTLPAVIMVVIGIVYLSLFGMRLVPRREQDDLTKDFQLRDYLTEITINDDSPAIGHTIGSLKLEKKGVSILALVRNHKKRKGHGNRKLKAGDNIIVKCSRDMLLQLAENKTFSIKTNIEPQDADLNAESLNISEAVLMPHSHLIGKSLKQTNFQPQYKVAVLAIYRRGQAYPTHVQDMPFKTGDVLLLQGTEGRIAKFAEFADLWLTQIALDKPLTIKKGIYVLLAMTGAILLTAFSILTPAVAFVLAVVVVVLIGCTNMEEAYTAIEWRLLVLIASMSSFGLAMQSTGTANYLANLVSQFVSPYGLAATLAAFALLTILLTQPMSNAAAALVVLPIAISTAELLNVDARPFAAIVTLSASLSFITPLEPASLLVYSAGKYHFMDFVKVGLPLTLITVALLVAIVPMVWPFR